MGALSSILRNLADNGLMFWCPGCDSPHHINYGEGRWTWNGNVDKPTFSPSLLVRTGHYIPGNEDGCWCKFNVEHPDEATSGFKCSICHSFVTDGKIQFLTDSTHSLVGQTVDIPEWPRVD